MNISKMAVILSANTQPFGAGLQVGGKDLDNFAVRVNSSGAMIVSTFARIGAAAAAIAAVGFGRGIMLAADMERTEAGIEVLVGSADKAAQVMKDLKQVANDAPSLDLPEVAAAAKSLLSFKGSAELVGAEVLMLANVAAGAGMRLGDLAEIYGKARVNQRMEQEDINQLTGRGINVISEFAKQMGIAEGEVRSYTKNGKIGFANLQQALVSMTTEGGLYFGMLDKDAQTLTGSWKKLWGTIDMALADIADGFLKTLNVSGGMKDLAVWVEVFGKKVKDVVTSVATWVRENKQLIYTTVRTVAVWGSSIAAMVTIIKIGGMLVNVYKAIAKSQIVMLAFGGVKGWAQIAAGALIAAGAAKMVGDAFDDVQTEISALVASAQEAAGETGINSAALAAKAAADMAKASNDGLNQSVKDLNEKLREEIATFGMSSRQIDIWKIAQQGASAAALQTSRDLDEQLSVMERQKTLMDELKRSGEQWLEDMKSPWEKLNDELEKVNELLKQKMYTEEQADAVSAMLADKAGESVDRQRRKDKSKLGDVSVQKLGAMERRFFDGFSKADAQGKTAQDKIAKATQDTAKNTAKIAAQRPKVASI